MLNYGSRGLPGKSSLAQLLEKERGRRNPKNLPVLTEDIILIWCDIFHTNHKDWPTGTDKRQVPTQPNESWSGINAALQKGVRGLSGKSSLSKLLGEKRGKRNRYNLPELTEKCILDWCDLFYAEHKEYPFSNELKPVPDHPDESWPAINSSLESGNRGLPGGSSLARLLERRGRKNLRNLPGLTEGIILTWCDAFFNAHGEWPSATDKRPIPNYPNESWSALDSALTNGRRGLVGGSSIPKLLETNRNRRNHKNLQKLTINKILSWCDAFFELHGQYPKTHERKPVPNQSNESWTLIRCALASGRRGLPKGSLAKILEVNRGVRNIQNLPKLTEDMILKKLNIFHKQYGEFPKSRDPRPVPGKPSGLTWQVISVALKSGRRGLPGKSSLRKLLSKYGKK